MRARDVMTSELIVVQPQTSVEEVANLLIEKRISAVPVVDEQRRMVGIVSEDDLFPRERCAPFSAERLTALFGEWVDVERLTEDFPSFRNRTAGQVMSRQVPSVGADDDIGDVAKQMVAKDLRRVMVLEDGVPVGIITRTDLLRLFTQVG